MAWATEHELKLVKRDYGRDLFGRMVDEIRERRAEDDANEAARVIADEVGSAAATDGDCGVCLIQYTNGPVDYDGLIGGDQVDDYRKAVREPHWAEAVVDEWYEGVRGTYVPPIQIEALKQRLKDKF